MFGDTINQVQSTDYLASREETILTVFESLETVNEEIVQEVQEDNTSDLLIETLQEISNQYAKLIEKLSER